MINTYTTVRGDIISTNETGTHCYMWPKGRKEERIRIKKHQYEQIIKEDQLERKTMGEQDETTETEIEAAVEAIEESQTTEEIKQIADELNHEQDEKSELPKGFEIKSDWDGDTTTYFLYKGGKCLSAHWEYEDVVAAAAKVAKTAPAKKRRPKDIAHESKCGVTLTAKQVDFLRHLPDSDFWTDGKDSEIWVDCLCDEIGGQFLNKPMTVGAMISTLCEKKLGVRCRQKVNGRTATSFALTDLGKTIMSELGID